MQTTLRTLAALLILTMIAVAQEPAAAPAAKPSTTTTKSAKTSATGATKTGTAAGSEARHKVAMELMQILLPKQHADQMIAQVDQQFLYLAAADYKKRGLTIPSDFESKMKSALTGLVSPDEIKTWGADSYAERFTAPELRQLIIFYNSPTGQKLIKMQPEISQEAMKKLLMTVDHRLPAAMQKEGLNPPPGPQQGAGSSAPGAAPSSAPGTQPAPSTTQPPAASQPPPK